MALENTNRWVLLWVLAAGWLLWLLSPILTPFVVAALLAYLGDPLVDRLEARRLPRTWGVSVVFLAMLIVVVLLAAIVLPRLGAQIESLVTKLPAYAQWLKVELLPWLQQWLPLDAEYFDPQALVNSLRDHWREAGGVVAGLWASLSNSGLVVLGWLANLVLIPVLLFYLLRDWDHLTASIYQLLPRQSAETWRKLALEADDVLGAFLRGQLSVMFALGVIYTTGLWMVGLDFALLIGMTAGIVSFVPYLGLIVGILIAGVAAYLQFQGFSALPAVVAVFVVGQLLEGMVLTPRLVGGRIGLHPVAVIFAVMAGGQLYGFFGILLALPVAAVVVVLLRHLHRQYRGSSFYQGAQPPSD